MSAISQEVRILYFAWVRERIGMEEENVTIPGKVKTVDDLLIWLASRGEEFAAALQYPDVIRVALDQNHVEHDQPIGSPREIALFPPMTGG